MVKVKQSMALAALSMAVCVPASSEAQNYKRTPDLPQTHQSVSKARQWEETFGRSKDSDPNFMPIERTDFNAGPQYSTRMKLKGAKDLGKKSRSFIQQAERTRAAEYLGNIYGVVNSSSPAGGQSRTYWGKLDFASMSVSPIFSDSGFTNSSDPDHQAGAVRDGILYIPEGIQSSVRDFDVVWKRYDLNTGERLPNLNFNGDAQMWVQAMCYDPISDCFFGMTGNDDNSSEIVANRIVKIDPKNNFKWELISDMPNGTGLTFSGFYYNPSDKEIYAFREDGQVFLVDRTSGRFFEAFQVYCNDPEDDAIVLSPFNDRGTTNIVFSPRDNALFLIAQDIYHNGEVYLFNIDLESDGECTRIAEISNKAMLVSLYCPDSFAAPEAAGLPVIENFGLVKDALKGSVEFAAPTTLYNDLKLNKDVATIATIDGKEVFNKTLKPGEKASFNFEVSEGVHTLDIHCDINANLPGPSYIYKFYAGNDTPKAPTGVAINGNTITWNAPGAAGANNGYVDTDALEYDVYFDNRKVNTEPVKTTSYTFTPPSSLELTTIQVKASANGKTSDFSESLLSIIGKALSLPYYATPTTAQAMLYTVVDGNNDGNTFDYDTQDNCFVLTLENYEGSNDWLVLPMMNFNDASKMYNFSTTFMNQTPYYGTETIEVWLGKDPEHMDIKLAEYPFIDNKDVEYPISVNFNVPEAGDYYIALRAHTPNTCSGAIFFSLSVTQTESTTKVPARIEDIVMTAGEKGAKEAVFNLTVPTKATDGSALDPSKKVTVIARNAADPDYLFADVAALPGEKVTLKCPGNKGFNTYLVTVENNEGENAAAILRGYIGLDTPKSPQNVKTVTADDNMTMTISWDPVTEGVNGGFIDPETLCYQVWNNPQGVTWNRVGDRLKETMVLFDPNYPTLSRWILAVLAENADGDFLKENRLKSVSDQLGKPVELPLIETFEATGVKYPWNYNRNTDETEMSSFATRTMADINSLGIGKMTCEGGSARVLSSLVYGQKIEGHLLMPKFCTKDMKSPVFNMNIWNYEFAPKFEIYARCAGSEELELLDTCTPDPEKYMTWNEYLLPLPEKYQDKQWVQFQIHFYLPAGGSSYGIIDKIQVYENIDHDYLISSITPEADHTYVGESTEFVVSATNGGLEDGTAEVKVSVYGDGEYLGINETYTIPRFRSFRTSNRRIPFTATAEMLKYDKITVRATIYGEGDEVGVNDSKEIVWNVLDTTNPKVTDLAGAYDDDHSKVTLTWSEPNLKYGNVDDFDFVPAWELTDRIGQWKNYDEDEFPTFAITGLEMWPHAGEKRAWQVMNAEELGVLQSNRLWPHSGKQCLVAFAGWDPANDTKSVQVADWLISPEVVGGTEVKFFVNHISTDYRETIHVMYSTTDDKPESFTKLCNISKQGTESWEEASFTLPEDAKYFALKYVGWDTLGILVDDIEFTPVNLTDWNIEGYDVYRKRDGENEFTFVGTTKDLNFTDTEVGDANVNYYIVTRASINGVKVNSAKSNQIRLFALSAEQIETASGISAAQGAIIFSGLSGKNAGVYTADGKLVKSAAIDSEYFTLPTEAGIYLVKVGDVIAKVLVK
ncbi:MAG: hypothetical protein HDS73_01195 [Bacteroidales bacterium]|nr:hypothetical protein [Bacteroidales bacterium]